MIAFAATHELTLCIVKYVANGDEGCVPFALSTLTRALCATKAICAESLIIVNKCKDIAAAEDADVIALYV